jgi:hypothetical protein
MVNDYDDGSTTVVGKSIISEKFPSTMDSFWFVVEYNTVINPFDFVSVDNINNSTSIGLIKDIQSVVIKETPHHSDSMKPDQTQHMSMFQGSLVTKRQLISYSYCSHHIRHY